MVVNKKALAEILGVSPRWVTTLIEDGLPVEGGGGRGKAVEIDTKKAVDWLIAREVSKQVGDDGDAPEGGPKDGTRDHAELRLARAKAEKEELAVEEIKGERILVDEAGQLIMLVAGVFGQQLDGVASRNASELAALSDASEVRQLLLSESRRVRTATAEHLRNEVARLRRGGGVDSGASAGSDPGPVGEPE